VGGRVTQTFANMDVGGRAYMDVLAACLGNPTPHYPTVGLAINNSRNSHHQKADFLNLYVNHQ
jgi:hypothetical protein